MTYKMDQSSKHTVSSMFLVLLCVSLMSARHAATAPPSTGFVVTVSTDGSYSLSVNGKIWLPNSGTFFYSDGARYDSGDGSLYLLNTTANSGVDKLGQWQDTEFLYLAGRCVVSAIIRTYRNLDIVIFTQKYQNTAFRTSSGSNSSVASGFPTFTITGKRGELGYLSYGGDQFGSKNIITGNWVPGTATVNTASQGGPIILFDHNQNVIIQSSFSQFMASAVYQKANNINWGIMGGVDTIPAMYEMSTIAFYGNQGINKAMDDWGALMRFWYDRDQSFTNSDLANNYLGYWTDNGAYYYGRPEEGKNFEETILDVKAYADKAGIPYRYVQYDDWWYYVGSYEGAYKWEARPNIFPHGLKYMYDKTGWPVFAHNRWWAPNTTYAKQNGGKYNFIISNTKAIPYDKNFWPDLLGEARKWGLITYEQDWLDQQFNGVGPALTTLNVARDWLMQMAKGAAESDINLQYCLSDPKQALQTLEISRVTNARVSRDYHASVMENWNIGLSSMFADALGVRPSKDNFWTKSKQPNNHYNLTELHTALESVIATLSTGPVGPSDMVGGSNVTLIMMSCNTDGRLLQPSRPARNIDANILQKAFGDGSGPDGEVWSTWSSVSGLLFGIILAPVQPSSVQITPNQAGFGSNFPQSVIFKHTWPSPTGLANFSDTEPLTIAGCDPVDPCLWHTAPTWTLGGSGVFIYGELQKWVPMSPKRVTKIAVSDDIYVTVIGAVEEIIEFSFGTNDESAEINTVTCNLGTSGSAIIQHLAKSCRQL